MKFDTEERMIDLLEAKDVDYFAEEWCIPKMRTMEAIESLTQAVRDFCRLCRQMPSKAEKLFSDLQNVKRKILQDLIRNHSLLNPESTNV